MMGLRIDYWAKQVSELWANGETERQELLSAMISKHPLKDQNGGSITSLSGLKSAGSTTKSDLNTQAQESDHRGKRLFRRHTAGTSGQPTEIRLNRDELGRMLGVREYCFNCWGVSLGDREARLWGRVEPGWQSKLKNFLMHRRVFHPVGRPSLAEIKRLQAWQPKYLYGYSSLILELAQTVDRNEYTLPDLKLIVCTAETILPQQKKYISEVLRAPVVEEYGSTEFDIIAFECINGHLHMVNPWHILHLNGDVSLLTDVSRRSQTIIRYNLNDSWSLIPVHECAELGGAKCVGSLEGRSINRYAYDLAGKKFHAVAFAHGAHSFMKKIGEAFRFSIEQSKVGEFQVGTSHESDEINREFINYLSDFLKKTEGVEVRIFFEPDVLRQPEKKKSYFSQKL